MIGTWSRREPARIRVIALGAALFLTVSPATPSRADGERNLAETSQNPVGELICVPFWNNVLFNTGPSDATACMGDRKDASPV